MYIDSSMQPWSCREEAILADRELARQRASRLVDEKGLRTMMEHAELAHGVVIGEMRAAVEAVETAGLSRKQAIAAQAAVRDRFKPRIDEACYRIGLIFSAARGEVDPKQVDRLVSEWSARFAPAHST